MVRSDADRRFACGCPLKAPTQWRDHQNAWSATAVLACHRQRVSPSNESIWSISSTNGMGSTADQRTKASVKAPSGPNSSSSSDIAVPTKSSCNISMARDPSSPRIVLTARAVSSRAAWPASKSVYAQRYCPPASSSHRKREAHRSRSARRPRTRRRRPPPSQRRTNRRLRAPAGCRLCR